MLSLTKMSQPASEPYFFDGGRPRHDLKGRREDRPSYSWHDFRLFPGIFGLRVEAMAGAGRYRLKQRPDLGFGASVKLLLV